MRSIAAAGDVSSVATWSGTPYFFWRAASEAGFASEAWKLSVDGLAGERCVWNLCQVLRGRGKGGFQYSNRFLDRLESRVSPVLKGSEIITFNQHFPRASTVAEAGGRLNHYVDAPFVALASGCGLDLHLPDSVVRNAVEMERLNYQASDRVITMGRWAAEVIKNECGVPGEKVHTILPGANITLPADWSFPEFKGGAGKERDFILGFVGKEWKRKGLPWLLDLRDELKQRGWRVSVHAAGNAPDALSRRDGLESVGYIDKEKQPAKFLSFLSGCDLGCLFSKREALGISTLEFLRAGVPVAGYVHEGMADTLPPDAGLRFELAVSLNEAADILEDYLRDEQKQRDFHMKAREWSSLVTWERCVMEFQELWNTSTIRNPVRPWLGLTL